MTEPPTQPVTPSQVSKRHQHSGGSGSTPTIELLYFSGCPNYQRALTLLHEVVKEAKLRASIDLVAVETPEEAVRQRFYGSPTIRVNGSDIVSPDPSAQPALACRVYRTAQGALSPLPPVEAIIAALQHA